MALYVLLGMLAAFGALAAVWTVWVFFLPKDTGCILICVGQPQLGFVTRWKWLAGCGLLRCPMIAVTDEELLYRSENIEQCSWETLASRLEMERKRIDGTGNGNRTGRHQRRDLSEL